MADKCQWAVSGRGWREEHTISAALSIMVMLVGWWWWWWVLVGVGDWNVCGESVAVLCLMMKLMRREIRTNLSRPSRFYLSPFSRPSSRASRCRQSSPTVWAQLASGTAATAPSPRAMASIRSSSHRPSPTPHGHPLRANGRLQKTAPTPLSGPRLSPGTLEPNPELWPKSRRA